MWLETTDVGSGAVLWERPVDHEYRALIVTGDTAYLAAAPDGVVLGRSGLVGQSPLLALDLTTGVERWTATFPPGRISGEVIGDTAYVVLRPPR